MKSVGEAMGIGRTFRRGVREGDGEQGARPRRRHAVAATSTTCPTISTRGFDGARVAEAERRRRGARVPARRLGGRRGRGGVELLLLDDRRAGRGGAAETQPRVVILGSGPNRIGQGIEFDYCCVHAAQAFRSLGYEAVMVNCNPETVSTDYDTSDRLYFEPLTEEYVLAVCEREQPDGVVIQFGGQTPLKLAHALDGAGFPILGTPLEAIDLAEDRKRFAGVLAEHGIHCPEWGIAESAAEAVAIAERIGYPVLVRPSYVLGGRAMRVCYRAGTGRRGVRSGTARLDARRPLPRGRPGDRRRRALRRTGNYVAAVMEHVEEAGVHSGDSSCALPAPSLDAGRTPRSRSSSPARARARRRRARQCPARARRRRDLGDRGKSARLADGAFREQGDGVNLVEAACRLMAGAPLRPRAPERRPATTSRQGGGVSVRSRSRAPIRARPGDARDGRGDGHGGRLPDRVRESRARRGKAVARSRARSSSPSVTPTSDAIVPVAAELAGLGFELVATTGTARALADAGIAVGVTRRSPRPVGTERRSSISSGAAAATSSSTRLRRRARPAPTATSSARRHLPPASRA